MQASKQEVPPYKIRKRMREEGEQDEERLTRLRTDERGEPFARARSRMTVIILSPRVGQR